MKSETKSTYLADDINGLETVASNSSKDPEELLAALEELRRELMCDDFDIDIDEEAEDEFFDDKGMDADDYHNKAVEKAKSDHNKEALNICEHGLAIFPTNTDLLGDAIKYACSIGNIQAAAKHYSALKEVPEYQWTWRAFKFSLDYLMENKSNINVEECRNLIKAYRKNRPYDEKHFLSESELEAAMGNIDESILVLEHAVSEIRNAPACALKLASFYFECGLFKKTIDTCNYGLMASCAVQPEISIPYLCFLRSLSKDALLHEKNFNGEAITISEVDAMRREYSAFENNIECLRFMRVIKNRLLVLDLLSVTAVEE